MRDDDAQGTGSEATTEQREPLTPSDIEGQAAEVLPARNAMSLITPGATGATPAAALLADEAMDWHGPPGQPHIL